MKAIFFLALIVLAAHAQDLPTSTGDSTGDDSQGFDLDAYFAGFVEQLGIDSQDGDNCLSTIKDQAQQLAAILQINQDNQDGSVDDGTSGDGTSGDGTSGDGSSSDGTSGDGTSGDGTSVDQGQNLDQLISSLFGFYSQAKSAIQGECQAFLGDLQTALEADSENPSMVGLVDPTSDEIIGANLDFYFPQVVKQIGTLVQQLHDASFNEAGATHAYILQILFGNQIPDAVAQPTSIPQGKLVTFNQKNFFTQYLNGFFKTLGGFKAADVTNNVKSISACYDSFTKINAQITSFQKQIAKLAALDTFFATKAFVSTFATNFKGCKPAFQLLDTLNTKINTKISASVDNKGWYQVFLNLALNFDQVENSLQAQATYVDQGKYEIAGNTGANTVKALFANVATFPL